jgi:hypothetical protein
MGGWSAPHPCRFTFGKDPVPIVQEAAWASGSGWTCAKNLARTGKSVSNIFCNTFFSVILSDTVITGSQKGGVGCDRPVRNRDATGCRSKVWRGKKRKKVAGKEEGKGVVEDEEVEKFC